MTNVRLSYICKDENPYCPMRVVIQRVAKASVSVEKETIGSIGYGLLVLVGICEDDTNDDAKWLAKKIAAMRIFKDEQQNMNLSVCDVQGDILVVSQFTLHAGTRKGNRPSFVLAARPEQAIPLYENFVEYLKNHTGKDIPTGQFGASMQVELVNDGPVTIIMDSRKKE